MKAKTLATKKTISLSLEEKMEMVYQSYLRNLDLELALGKPTLGLSEEEKEAIRDDEYFRARVEFVDSELQEELILNLRNLAKSENENIQLKSTLELGKMVYKKRFSDRSNQPIGKVPDKIILKGADE